MSVSEYCEITLDVFLNMTGQLPFDVYIQLTPEKFTKLFKRGDDTDKGRFENYAKKGAEKLYIHRNDRRDYIGATERLIRKMVGSQKFMPKDAYRALEELSEQTLFEIFEDKIFDEESVYRAQDTIRSYVQVLKNDAGVLGQFIQLAKNETYMVRHSIAAAVFALLLGRAAQNTNEKLLEIIGTGALLHDIGMSALPSNINELDRKLTGPEWKAVKEHPDLGLKMTESLKNFPPEIYQVIAQHQESYDGTGYPKQLRAEEIYYPARIVAVADCFSALTTRRGGRSLFSPSEALALMQSERLKFDPTLMTAFTKLLSPKKRRVA